jgi:hypothetical protein
MSLGDATARTLIHKLVEEAAKLASTPRSTLTLRMTRTLALKSGAWHFEGEITVPGSITRPELSSILGNIDGQIGSRFELYAVNSDQDTTLLALASERTRGSDTHFLLERPPRTRSGIRGPVAAGDTASTWAVGAHASGRSRSLVRAPFRVYLGCS